MSVSDNILSTSIAKASTEQLHEWAVRYPWWGAVRLELSHRGEGCCDSVLYAQRLRERCAPSSPLLKTITSEELQRSPMLNIIDDFLREGEHRIVIGEETTDAPLEPTMESDEALEEEFVSEELAEIYAKQHLFDLAIEIYQKLSLQDSQKSIYFAELIERLKEEQAKSEQ